MPVKKSRATPLAMPGKAWANRVGFLVLAVSAVSLMVMSKAHNPKTERLRDGITDAVAPVLGLFSSPLDAMHNMSTWISDMATLRAENIALKNQNIQLLQWQAAARDMEKENTSLKALLKVIPTEKSSYVTARVVSDMGGPYVHSALINGGSDNGIKKDEAVINENGLIGRVVDVGNTSARVLLLTDINSHVPVIAEHANEKGILSGNNGSLTTLSYLPADSHIAVGERIVTSGDGGIFPAGVPVGIVTSIDGGTVSVQPFVDPSRIEFVSVIDYSL